MRSTKDLKDIVASQRANSKMNGIYGAPDYSTTDTNNKENGMMSKKYSTTE